MASSLSSQEFVAKWRKITAREKQASQSHFNDLCLLVGHPTPLEADPKGEWFCFEKGAAKQTGGDGWADVWKKGYFAWEYKGKRKDLSEAYAQLALYRESLENPPLLVVSDMETILVHTNFNNTTKKIMAITYDELLTPNGLRQLSAVFYNPESFRTPQTTEQVTEEAAKDFAHLAGLLRDCGAEPQQVAHFLIRLLFCLFAEDIGLLPQGLFTQLVRNTSTEPLAFRKQLGILFREMASGGWFGGNKIRHFDGRLFDSDTTLELSREGIDILLRACALDWSSIEPSILGTLFERSLDPSKRSQIGAHYTSKEDILLIIESVLMKPFRDKWEDVKQQALRLASQRDNAGSRSTRTRYEKELVSLLTGFASELGWVQILDPACGSGNFLYVALKELLDLEKEVVTLASMLDIGRFFPSVSPTQLHGIEINQYAHELAQATVWIGYIQWLRDNGFGLPSEPILKPIDTVTYKDAILPDNHSDDEPVWPEVDFIISNPPFLGGKLLRSRLGDDYVDRLFEMYEGRVARESDLVCYWFEKARAMVAEGKAKRVGLLATQGIRGGANRRVLERIKETSDIFWAQSDRDWIQEGAAVRVSMVGFDNGEESIKSLDDELVDAINADLTGEVDLTKAKRLKENRGMCFMGDTKGGPFDIPSHVAMKMINVPSNPNGRPNSDIVRPWVNGTDVTRRPRGMWIIDFGANMLHDSAALYEMPFEYVQRRVKPKSMSHFKAGLRLRLLV